MRFVQLGDRGPFNEDRRIVHRGVEPAISRHCGVDHGGDGGHAGHVRNHEVSLAALVADCLRDSIAPGFVDIRQHHLGAGLGE